MRKHWGAWVLVLFLGAFVFIGWNVVSVALQKHPKPQWENAVFKVGQMVRSKVGGHIGMVIGLRRCNPTCYYDVRFNAVQTTINTSLFGGDGPLETAPLAVITHMHEYELEAIE